ncbi:AMP-binding protein [Brevibacterium album]|uniref:AMP-binding protein n=1 Tax=Brevibacterium album TaxID=417948 RepID=UPI00041F7AEB|nr:AMP-binding protein [Brevibacterium album]
MIVDQVSRMLAGETGLILPRDRSGEVTEFRAGQFDPADTGRSAPALVLFTSGSTGTPKGVGLSLDALTASARETERLLAGPGLWHLCLPANHIAGFQVVFRSLLAGHTPSLASPGPFDARSFAAELTALHARAGAAPVYTSLVPTQLVRVLAVPEAASAAARCAAVLVGGAALSPRLLERAQEAGIPLVRTYGMSETAGGCVYDGRPFPDVRVRLDAHGRVVLAGPVLADGYLRVREDGGPGASGLGATVGSASGTRHAMGAPGATEVPEAAEPDGPLLTAVPNGILPGAGGPRGTADLGGAIPDGATDAVAPGFWGEGAARLLVTSDLGRWEEAPSPSQGAAGGGGGRLAILGRADDIIITGGENVSPHEVEAHLLRVAEPLGFREALVTSVPDEEWGQVLVALLVPDADHEVRPDGASVPALLPPSVQRTLQGGLRALGMSPAQLPRAAYAVEEIPSRGIGKPDRRAARELTQRCVSQHFGSARFSG